MSCVDFQNSLSAHLDGLLLEQEKRQVTSHLASCPDCSTRLRQMTRVKAALRSLPKAVPPPQLTVTLRVAGSRERARLANRRHPLRHLSDRVHLWIDNLMRPLALPLAGGLISAVLLFAMLLPQIALRRSYGLNDIRVGFMTDPYVKAQTPLGFEDDFLLEVMIDGQGRMVDYAIAEGPSLPAGSKLRRQIENYLLFTEFKPATMFGMPKVGKMYLSISRRQIEVKS